MAGARQILVIALGLLAAWPSVHAFAASAELLRVSSSIEARSCVAIASELTAGLDRYSLKREPLFRLENGEFADVTVVSGLTLEAPPATTQVVLRALADGASCEVFRIESPERFYALVARLEIGVDRLTMTGQGLGCPPPDRVRSNVRAEFALRSTGLEVLSVRVSGERKCNAEVGP